MDWKRRFDDAAEEFRADLRELAKTDYELLAQATVKLADLPSVMNQLAVLNCISRFTEAELDADSPGERGLGRLSTEVPRFGAYFRKALGRLPPKEIDALRQRIVAQLVAGYCSHLLLSEPEVLEPTIPDEEALFKEWVPVIYSSALPNSFPQDALTALEVLTTDAVTCHRQLLAKLGLRGGGFLERDKTGLILNYYSLAGFGLRAMETRKK